MITPAREAWRLHKARILIELAAFGQAWEIQSGVRFEIRLSISEGVPFCQVVSGDEILAQGALT